MCRITNNNPGSTHCKGLSEINSNCGIEGQLGSLMTLIDLQLRIKRIDKDLPTPPNSLTQCIAHFYYECKTKIKIRTLISLRYI